MHTKIDLDPGIISLKANRRIMSVSQIRNEIMFHRENSDRNEVTINLFGTNTRPTDDNTFVQNQRRQQAAGYSEIQFHYHINTNGFTYTGLELSENSALNNGDNICIGIAGGLSADGTLPRRHTLSSFSTEQVDALIAIISQLVLTFDKVRIVRQDVDTKQGLCKLNLIPADIRKRVDRRIFNG